MRVKSLFARSHVGRSEQTCIKRSSLSGCCSLAVLCLSCTSYTVPAAPSPIIVFAACGSGWHNSCGSCPYCLWFRLVWQPVICVVTDGKLKESCLWTWNPAAICGIWVEAERSLDVSGMQAAHVKCDIVLFLLGISVLPSQARGAQGGNWNLAWLWSCLVWEAWYGTVVMAG